MITVGLFCFSDGLYEPQIWQNQLKLLSAFNGLSMWNLNISREHNSCPEIMPKYIDYPVVLFPAEVKRLKDGLGPRILYMFIGVKKGLNLKVKLLIYLSSAATLPHR